MGSNRRGRFARLRSVREHRVHAHPGDLRRRARVACQGLQRNERLVAGAHLGTSRSWAPLVGGRGTRAIFDDELGSLAKDYSGTSVSWQGLISVLRDPGSRWWDDVTTGTAESSKEIVSGALDWTASGPRGAG